MQPRKCQSPQAVVVALPMVGAETRMKMIWNGQDDVQKWQATCAVLLSKEGIGDEHKTILRYENIKERQGRHFHSDAEC